MLNTTSDNLTGQRRGSISTLQLVYLAIFTALVIILQFVSNITAGILPVPITLTLVPIVLAVALNGKWSGAWLGFVFGATVLFSGASEPFFTVNPFGTIVTVLLKGVLAGLIAGIVYSAFEKKNRYLAIILAGATAPIVNTGVFIVGCFTFFYDYVLSLAGGENIFIFIVTVFAGVNFLIELSVNMLLAPIILRLINLKK